MPKHKKNIAFFKRYMHDMFAIWKKQGEHDNEFEEFKKKVSTISNLNWEFEELSEKLKFSDLGINMNREFKTFDYKVHENK